MLNANTVRLADVVRAETRAAAFDEMMADLAALNPQTPVEHDRVTFMRLFAVALVEGLREREPEGAATAGRVFELFGAAAAVFGTYLAANFAQHWPDDMPDEHRAFLAQHLIDNLALGVSTGLRPNGSAPAPDEGEKTDG